MTGGTTLQLKLKFKRQTYTLVLFEPIMTAGHQIRQHMYTKPAVMTAITTRTESGRHACRLLALVVLQTAVLLTSYCTAAESKQSSDAVAGAAFPTLLSWSQAAPASTPALATWGASLLPAAAAAVGNALLLCGKPVAANPAVDAGADDAAVVWLTSDGGSTWSAALQSAPWGSCFAARSPPNSTSSSTNAAVVLSRAQHGSLWRLGLSPPWTATNVGSNLDLLLRCGSAVAMVDAGTVAVMGGTTCAQPAALVPVLGATTFSDTWHITLPAPGAAPASAATVRQVSKDAPWGPAAFAQAQVVPGGAADDGTSTIVLLGGAVPCAGLGPATCLSNAVHVSRNRGLTWSRLAACSPWQPRTAFGLALVPLQGGGDGGSAPGMLVAAGGRLANGSIVDDAWGSIDLGASWRLVSGRQVDGSLDVWSPRAGLALASLLQPRGAKSSSNDNNNNWFLLAVGGTVGGNTGGAPSLGAWQAATTTIPGEAPRVQGLQVVEAATSRALSTGDVITVDAAPAGATASLQLALAAAAAPQCLLQVGVSLDGSAPAVVVEVRWPGGTSAGQAVSPNFTVPLSPEEVRAEAVELHFNISGPGAEWVAAPPSLHLRIHNSATGGGGDGGGPKRVSPWVTLLVVSGCFFGVVVCCCASWGILSCIAPDRSQEEQRLRSADDVQDEEGFEYHDMGGGGGEAGRGSGAGGASGAAPAGQGSVQVVADMLPPAFAESPPLLHARHAAQGGPGPARDSNSHSNSHSTEFDPAPRMSAERSFALSPIHGRRSEGW